MVSDDDSTIFEGVFAAYSHHHKTIVTKAPWLDSDFAIPRNLSGYRIINKAFAHFSIGGWAHIEGGDREVSISEWISKESERNEKK